MKSFDPIEKFNNLNVQLRITIFLLLLVLVGSLDYFFVVNWQMEFIRKTKEEAQTLKDNAQHIHVDRQRIDQIQKGRETIQAQLDQMSSRIRSVQEVPAILQEISKTASDVGVAIDQVMPQKAAQEILLKSPEGYYYSLPIVIQAHCGYHMFGHFLNRLEHANLLFTVREFRLESNEKEPGNLGVSVVLKVTLIDKNPPPEVEVKKK